LKTAIFDILSAASFEYAVYSNLAATDPTMFVALNAIATQQASPTTRTMARVKQLLDYCASQEEAILTYHSSGMILAIHSDAGYLNES